MKRLDKLTAGEQRALEQLLEYAPSLRTLRQFVDELGPLFERGQAEATAWRRHAALLSNPCYAAVPELAQALGMLAAEKFGKMIALLRSPVGARVRTNNHVERTNRWLRQYAKSRYKWRAARTKVRFVWLLMDRRREERLQEWSAARGTQEGRAPVGEPVARECVSEQLGSGRPTAA